MGEEKEKIKKLIDDILAQKRDAVFSRMDVATNNIITQLEELKALDDFLQYEIPGDLVLAGKAAGAGESIDILHRYVKKISASASQLNLITDLLEGVNHFCSRAALFLLREDKLVGWRGKGFSDRDGEISDEEIKKIFFSLSANTIFKYVLDKKKSYQGPPSPQPDDHLIYSRFGGKIPEKVFALPFSVKGKPQAVIYSDSFEGKPIGEKEIEMLAAVGEMSLDYLPFRQKILAKVKTKELPDEPEEPELKPDTDDRTIPRIKDSDPQRLARVIVNDILLYQKKDYDEGIKKGNLYDTLKDAIMQSRELYLRKYTDLSAFERQLVETIAKGNKDLLKGYKFETL